MEKAMGVVRRTRRLERRNAAAWALALLMATSGCSSEPDSPLHPSFEELTEMGFYVFTLPEGEVCERAWVEETHIYSWDAHCSYGMSSPPNPVGVEYTNPADDEYSMFWVQVHPWSVVWNHNEPARETLIQMAWSADGTAEYYVVEQSVNLRFKDTLGNYVQIGSTLPVSEVIRLANTLEYVGPPEDSVTNPWDGDVCESRRKGPWWR